MKPALSRVGMPSFPIDAANACPHLEGLVRRGDPAHHLDQLHDLGRVEEVEAEEALRPRGGGGLVDHRQRGRVGREHRLGLDDGVHLAPHLELEVEVLGDRLDHEVAVGEVGVVERALDPAAHRVGVVLLEPALLDGAARAASRSSRAPCRAWPGRPRAPRRRSRACAATCAIPCPIRPQPSTPTFLISTSLPPVSSRRAPGAYMSLVNVEDRGAVRHLVLNRPRSATR